MGLSGNIILHIPHSSPFIPSFDGYLVEKQLLEQEVNLLTDWFTDELFDQPLQRIVTPFSRIFCDVERFEDDSREIMAQKGMGMCYTHRDNGELMRVVKPELREHIKSNFYYPHHQNLEAVTTKLLNKNRQVLIIDCHSFSDIPFNRDMDQELPRPDFCLGVDTFHTPERLYSDIKDYLSGLGYNVVINRPYSGTMIPIKFYCKNDNVKGLMIEVNRRLYMTSSNDIVLKTKSFDEIKAVLNGIFEEISI